MGIALGGRSGAAGRGTLLRYQKYSRDEDRRVEFRARAAI